MDTLTVTFEVDPSTSGVPNENIRLVEYMRDRYLNFDIYDGESHFLFASAKLPMIDLIRQGAPAVIRDKLVEATHPHLDENRCELVVNIRHEGHNEKEYISSIRPQT
jgi:hypothetical protein